MTWGSGRCRDLYVGFASCPVKPLRLPASAAKNCTHHCFLLLLLLLLLLQKRLRTEVFLRETIPWWLAPIGYGGLVSTASFNALLHRSFSHT
jgi:hypothetical protein